MRKRRVRHAKLMQTLGTILGEPENARLHSSHEESGGRRNQEKAGFGVQHQGHERQHSHTSTGPHFKTRCDLLHSFALRFVILILMLLRNGPAYGISKLGKLQPSPKNGEHARSCFYLSGQSTRSTQGEGGCRNLKVIAIEEEACWGHRVRWENQFVGL